ncbi:MAG: Hsp20 family protein [Rhizobiales bacterium]|nr:Hsp20 family protein [Hyphomicrobiales bacterium]MBI3673012.1 Hsp20 family protein [Hyphomicrobiales bacterium]
MSRVPMFSSPLLLGFDDLERLLERAVKTSGDGYPPYNIERLPRAEGEAERLRITLAVAGFGRDEIDVTIEENQLMIRGRQNDDETRAYLHRGIAARQFARAFVLADGMEVRSARLTSGLLEINLERPEPKRLVRRIEIGG